VTHSNHVGEMPAQRRALRLIYPPGPLNDR
jgi:hypothetical protein